MISVKNARNKIENWLTPSLRKRLLASPPTQHKHHLLDADWLPERREHGFPDARHLNRLERS